MNKYKRLILKGQENVSQIKVIDRDIKFNKEYLNLNKIISFIGPRRAGKTYYMLGVIQKLICEKKITLEEVIFIDFTSFLYEDFDIEKLLESFFELEPDKKPFLILDEIQELDEFNKIVMYLFNNNYKIFLSGSNSKLLSSELSTIFRGRTIDIRIFPLNFNEYLRFKDINISNLYTEKEIGLLNNTMQDYLKFGAYPEIALSKQKETKLELIKSYFTLLLYKDLLERYGVENEYIIKFLIRRLLLGVTKEFNVNKIFNELKSQNIKVGKQTIYNYLEYLKEIFFITELHDEFRKGKKKFFFYDVGYNNIILEENIGQRFENIVFSHLKIYFEKLYYRKTENSEIDFVIPEKNLAIQVCYELNSGNFEREISAFEKIDTKNKILVYFFMQRDYEVKGVKLLNLFEFINEIKSTYENSK